jgi:hypothetical protein
MSLPNVLAEASLRHRNSDIDNRVKRVLPFTLKGTMSTGVIVITQWQCKCDSWTTLDNQIFLNALQNFYVKSTEKITVSDTIDEKVKSQRIKVDLNLGRMSINNYVEEKASYHLRENKVS